MQKHLKLIGYFLVAVVAVTLTYYLQPTKVQYLSQPLANEDLLSQEIDALNFQILATQQLVEHLRSQKTNALDELKAIGAVKERHINPHQFIGVLCDFSQTTDITVACNQGPSDPRFMTLEGRKEIAAEKAAQTTGTTVNE